MAIEPTIDFEQIPEISPNAPVIKDYIQRSIDALDDIKEAIEYHDIEVPDPTPIEEYEELIKLIKGFDINNYPWTPFEGVVQSNLIDGDPIYGYMESNWDEAFDNFINVPDKVLEGGNDAQWSKTKRYMAIARNDIPSAMIFNVEGAANFTNIVLQGIPEIPMLKIVWRPDDSYIVFQTAENYIFIIYKFDGTNITRIGNLPTIPTGNINDFCWSPDGNYFMVGTDTAPFLYVYRFNSSGNLFTLLSRDAVIPQYALRSFSWRPSDQNILHVTQDNNSSDLYYFNSSGLFSKLLTDKTNTSAIGGLPSFNNNLVRRLVEFGPDVTGNRYVAYSIRYSPDNFSTIFIYRVINTKTFELVTQLRVTGDIYSLEWYDTEYILGYRNYQGNTTLFPFKLFRFNGSTLVDTNVNTSIMTKTYKEMHMHRVSTTAGTMSIMAITDTSIDFFLYTTSNNQLALSSTYTAVSNIITASFVESENITQGNIAFIVLYKASATSTQIMSRYITLTSTFGFTLHRTDAIEIGIQAIPTIKFLKGDTNVYYLAYSSDNEHRAMDFYSQYINSFIRLGRISTIGNGTLVMPQAFRVSNIILAFNVPGNFQVTTYKYDSLVTEEDEGLIKLDVPIASNVPIVDVVSYNLSSVVDYPKTYIEAVIVHGDTAVTSQDYNLVYSYLNIYDNSENGNYSLYIGNVGKIPGGVARWMNQNLLIEGITGNIYYYDRSLWGINVVYENAPVNHKFSEAAWFTNNQVGILFLSSGSIRILAYAFKNAEISFKQQESPSNFITAMPKSLSMSIDDYLIMWDTDITLRIYTASDNGDTIRPIFEQEGNVLMYYNASTAYPLVGYYMNKTQDSLHVNIHQDKKAAIGNTESIGSEEIEVYRANTNSVLVYAKSGRFAAYPGDSTTGIGYVNEWNNGDGRIYGMTNEIGYDEPYNYPPNFQIMLCICPTYWNGDWNSQPTVQWLPFYAMGSTSGSSVADGRIGPPNGLWPGAYTGNVSSEAAIRKLYNMPSPYSSSRPHLERGNQFPGGYIARYEYIWTPYTMTLSMSDGGYCAYVRLEHPTSGVITKRFYGNVDCTTREYSGSMPSVTNTTLNSLDIIWHHYYYDSARGYKWQVAAFNQNGTYRFYYITIQNSNGALTFSNMNISLPYHAMYFDQASNSSLIVTKDAFYRLSGNPANGFKLNLLRTVDLTVRNGGINYEPSKISYNGKYVGTAYGGRDTTTYNGLRLYELTPHSFMQTSFFVEAADLYDIEVGKTFLTYWLGSVSQGDKRTVVYTINEREYTYSDDTVIEVNSNLVPFYNAETFDIFAWSLDKRVCIIDNWVSDIHQISVFTLDNYKLNFRYNIPLPSAPINFAWSDNNEYLIVLFEVEPYIQIYKYDAPSIQFTLTNFAIDNPIPSKKAYWAHNNKYFALVNNEMPVYKLDINTFIKLDPPATIPFIDMTDLSWAYNSRFISALDIRANKMYIYRLLNDELTLISEV